MNNPTEFSEEEFLLWETDDEEDSEIEQPQRIFVGEVRVIAVIKVCLEKRCLLCQHLINTDDNIFECCCCRTLQLLEECDIKISAKFIVKTKWRTRFTVWAHEGLHQLVKCDLEDAKKELLNSKFLHT